MNIEHIFLKRKHKFTQLLLSIIAVLLIISLIPTTAFADDGKEAVIGVTGANGGGAAGRKPTGPGNGDWSKIIQGHGNYAFMGYRVYVVNSSQQLQSKVVDLFYSTPSNLANVLKYSTKLCGDIKEYGKSNYGYGFIVPAAVNEEATLVNNKLNVYPAGDIYGSSDSIYGNNFKNWMMIEDSNGDTNAQELMYYAFGSIDAQKYLANKEYKLIVEPLFYSDIWTTREYIDAKQSIITDTYMEHYVVYNPFTKNAFDMCHSKSDTDALTLVQLRDYLKSEGYKLNFSNNTNNVVYSRLYNNRIYKAKKDEEDIKKELGYTGAYKTWRNSQKIEFYKKMVSKNKTFMPGVKYLTSAVSSGYEYTSANPVSYVDSSGNTTFLYADYTVVYDYDWTDKMESQGKHYVSAYTGKTMYGTYWDLKDYLATVPSLVSTTAKGSDGGVMKDTHSYIGTGFCTEYADNSLGIPANFYGMHIYNMDDIGGGNPIHTKDPSNPNSPSDPETPSEPNKNTGNAEIVKVYGKVYKDDAGNILHVEHVDTRSMQNTTDWIVIEDESPYKIYEWREAETLNTSYKATDWLTNTGRNIFKYATAQKSTASTLLRSADDNFRLTTDTNTLYVLYLKEMPYIETSDKSIPDTPDPNDTYPENPYNPTPKPDKQGSFNIIKVYAILDEYNGKVISSNTYPQKSTTPFIKIESTPESKTWTLAQWKVTNKYNQSITANDWCGEATTEDQLSKFYLNHFYDISTTSTNKSKFGTVYGIGTSPCTKYISNGNTIYILFVKTNGDF